MCGAGLKLIGGSFWRSLCFLVWLCTCMAHLLGQVPPSSASSPAESDRSFRFSRAGEEWIAIPLSDYEAALNKRISLHKALEAQSQAQKLEIETLKIELSEAKAQLIGSTAALISVRTFSESLPRVIDGIRIDFQTRENDLMNQIQAKDIEIWIYRGALLISYSAMAFHSSK